jgi:myosin protein heavy chain/myosin heavy chain 6/7
MQTDGQANLADSNPTPSSLPENTQGGVAQPSLSDQARPDSAQLEGGQIDVVALQAEVAKWQERVPKLAAALRERTDELAKVRDALRLAQQQAARAGEHSADDGAMPDARLQARDELIAELQQKISSVSERHKSAASELHATQLDLEEAREEAQRWQSKWQAVTSSLDSSVANASRSSEELATAKRAWEAREAELIAAHNAALQRAQRSVESLNVRNSKLQETIEFANKQLATLGEDMTLLIDQGKAGEQALHEAREEVGELQAADADLRQQVAALHGELEDRQRDLQQVLARVDAVADEKRSSEQQVQQHQQRVAELEDQLMQEEARYANAMQAAEQEQEQLASQLEAKDLAIGDLRTQLVQLQQEQDGLRREIAELRAANAAADDEKQAQAAEREQQISALTTQLAELAALREAEAGKAVENADRSAKQTQTLQESLQRAQSQVLELRREQAAAAEELAGLREARQKWQATQQTLQQRLDALGADAHTQQSELEAEIRRLSVCVEQAQSSHAKLEDERRALLQKVERVGDENARLKSNLEERSNLVRELEQENSQRKQGDSANQELVLQLQRELKEALTKMETFQDHASNLEDKLTTQKGLMSELEEELSQSQEDSADALKQSERALREEAEAHRTSQELIAKLEARCEELGLQNQQLHEELGAVQQHERDVGVDEQDAARLRELEQLLRERTEELDGLRWRLEQTQAQDATKVDENVVMVLNQQLADAQQENQRLREKITAREQSQSVEEDDLTALKGIGEKLAEQLAELGVSTIAQIAELKARDLDDTEHPLHGFKNRILRDDWIKQAKAELKMTGRRKSS